MKLSDKEVESRLLTLNGWSIENSYLVKEFCFADFPSAIKFMNDLAPLAEELNHHPDWTNSYNKVLIKLSTHSEGGLTDKDFLFAAAADKATQS